MAAFFAMGEFFHSRAKIAIAPKAQKSIFGQGLHGGCSLTPGGVYTSQRDPLLHAEIFSKYLAKNMRLITACDSTLSIEEQKAFEATLKANQLKTAEYYKAIRVLRPFAKHWAEKVRHRLSLQKKAEEKEIQW